MKFSTEMSKFSPNKAKFTHIYTKITTNSGTQAQYCGNFVYNRARRALYYR